MFAATASQRLAKALVHALNESYDSDMVYDGVWEYKSEFETQRTTDLIVPFNIHHLSIMVPNFDSYTPVGALSI